VSALQMEEQIDSTQTTPTLWKSGEHGTITANKIYGGLLQSTNWGASAGSKYDLNAGKFYLGGSAAPKLSWNGTDLIVCGVVCATSGCFSGTITSTSGAIGGWSLGANYICISCASGHSVCHGNFYSSYQYNYSGTCYLQNTISEARILMQSCWNGGFSSVQIDPTNNGTGSNAVLMISVPSTSCTAAKFGGVIYVVGTCYASDRNIKENITPVSVLGKIRNLPISEWSFKGDLIRHVGPMAQDFYEIFKGYSSDPKAIGGLDGIALKGVQELDRCVESLKSCIHSLESRLCNLETRLLAA